MAATWKPRGPIKVLVHVRVASVSVWAYSFGRAPAAPGPQSPRSFYNCVWRLEFGVAHSQYQDKAGNGTHFP